MACEEPEPARADAYNDVLDNGEDMLSADEDDDEVLNSNLPSTQAENRREQKAIFEAWL